MTSIPKEVIIAAEAAQAKWLVPSSVTIAQWALESDYGKHEPVGSNNPFGIKAVAGQDFVEANTHEVVNGQSIPVVAKFAKYASLEDAFDAHGKLLATHPVYKSAMAARMSADGFANALTGHYATDPAYGSKLIEIMKANNLYEYDKLAPVPSEPVAASPEVKAPAKAEATTRPAAPVTTISEEPQHEPVIPGPGDHPGPAAPAPNLTPAVADVALLVSVDKLIADLTTFRAALVTLKTVLGGLI